MAALTASAVTPYPAPVLAGDISQSEWPASGKGNRSLYTRRCKVVLTAQGTAANPIGPDAFGFTKFVDCGPLFDRAGAKVVPAMVDPVANIILLGAPGTGTPTDVTSADAYITITGVVKP